MSIERIDFNDIINEYKPSSDEKITEDTENSTNNYFDPELEFKRIKKIQDGKQRKEELALFREKRDFQRNGLTEIEMQIFKLIQNNPEISKDELMDYKSEDFDESISALENKYNLSEKQRKIIDSILCQYHEKHDFIKSFIGEFYNGKGEIDKNKLYERVFWGDKPNGEIEVIVGSMIISIRMKNADDFLKATGMSGIRTDISDEDIKGKVGGKMLTFIPAGVPHELMGSLLIENLSATTKKPTDSILKHEEQHAFNYLVKNAYSSEKMSGREADIKDEISAYFATPGQSMQGIKDILKNRFYNYNLESAVIDNVIDAWQSLQDKFYDDYFVHVNKGEISEELERKLREEARLKVQATLFKEKILQWPKIVNNLLTKKVAK